ncbi:MAG: hypothetical protein ABI977_06070 [Acidobacteriota bacterium]
MTEANTKIIAARLDPKRQARLVSATLSAIVETEEQNEHYLGVIEELMRKGENLAPEEEMPVNLPN